MNLTWRDFQPDFRTRDYIERERRRYNEIVSRRMGLTYEGPSSDEIFVPEVDELLSRLPSDSAV